MSRKDVYDWLKANAKSDSAIAVRPSELAEELDATPYEVRSVLKALRDKGWIMRKESDPYVYWMVRKPPLFQGVKHESN